MSTLPLRYFHWLVALKCRGSSIKRSSDESVSRSEDATQVGQKRMKIQLTSHLPGFRPQPENLYTKSQILLKDWILCRKRKMSLIIFVRDNKKWTHSHEFREG